MNLAHAGIAVTLAAAAYAVTLPAVSMPDPMTVSSIDATPRDEQRFALHAGGRDAGCVVTAASPADGKRPLRLASACAHLVPGLDSARWWLERSDGTVAFAEESGRVVAEFAVADGADLESYAPRQPIMTLLSR